MPRKRKTNNHLPQRVYWKNGAYRLLTKEGKWIRLGVNLAEMYQTLSNLHLENNTNKIHTFNQLMDLYLSDIAVQKAPSSYKSDLRRSKFLKAFFGLMRPCDITAVNVYQYLDRRAKAGKTGANRECALLSHVLGYAIRWGLITINPCTGVKKFSEEKRSRNVSDVEFDAVLSIAKYPVNFAMQLAYLMGLRPQEALRLKKSNMLEEGFLVEITKTKHSVGRKIVQWSPTLKSIVENLLNTNEKTICNIDYILTNKQGKLYTYDGFATLWHRTMKEAIASKKIKQSFQFRDIRHKAATDIESSSGREVARQLLGHTNQTTTARYIDNAAIVRAVK